MIERAAALMGTTVSGFMLQNAYEAARRVVSDYDTLMLTQLDFEAFASSMENHPSPKPHCANSWRANKRGCHPTARQTAQPQRLRHGEHGPDCQSITARTFITTAPSHAQPAR